MKGSNSQFNAVSPILTTSLRIPRLHEGLITRPALVDMMDQALDFPLTLISAPAGFGKTTLLGQWISARRQVSIQDRVAWVSLEKEFDLHQFWTYTIRALQEIHSRIGKSALASLDTSQPPIHAILRMLINEISEVAEELVLILDDYHHIDDPSIHATLTFFIDHLPSNLHLVVVSRSQPPLPLARLRVGNQLYELREDDLRFKETEVSAFFNEIKGLNLSPEEIRALENRTEGWIAGLQLVALSIQASDDESKRRFVSAFTGSQRYILDYLVEEVLLQQPDHIKSFLRQTSILDHLSASLCNAVTGKNDGQAILEYLERAHIFTISLDHEQQWYRYHHLFRDVLYHRLLQLEPDSVLELHRRASVWFIRAGRTDEAIRHTCAAKEWDQAIELIEPAIQATWNRGEIRKIINWLGRLPDKYLKSRPHIYLYYLRALLHGGQMEAAEQRIREIEAMPHNSPDTLGDAEDRQLLGTIYALRTTIAAISDEPETALTLGAKALRLLPPTQIELRAYGINSLGVAHYYLGNMTEAARAFEEGSKLAEKAGQLYSRVAGAAYQAKALMSQGQLQRGRQILEEALQVKNPSIRSARITAAGLSCAVYGSLLYEWDMLEEAEQYLTEAIELGQQLSYGSALWSAYHTLAHIKQLHGDQKSAEALIEQAQRYRLSYTVLLPVRLMDADEARANLILGKVEDVERWARTHPAEQSTSARFVDEIEGLTRARIYLSQNKPEEALTLLDQLRSTAESSDRQGHVIEMLALTALAQHVLGKDQQALETLHQALQMAEPEGYLRTFIDAGPSMAALLYQALAQDIMPEYVRRLLAAFSTDDAISSSSLNPSHAPQVGSAHEQLIEPLSEREVEVLQLMASGASNQEIAESLVIATTTAKKHVSNIIRKLGADNRTQAVAKGRNLGLCE